MRRVVGRRVIPWMVLLVVGCASARPEAGRPPPSPLLTSLQLTRAADRLTFLLQVTNTSGDPIELNFPSGQSADFVVTREGAEVWRWSDGRSFTQALRREVVGPGESRTYHAEWEPPEDLRGDFTATGILTATGTRVEQATRFSLP